MTEVVTSSNSLCLGASMRLLLADILLVVHFLFIGYVLLGQVFIVAGYFRKWRWVRHVGFRTSHVLAIGFVVVQALLGALCPLTIWENALRESAGRAPYPGTFIEYWLGSVVYYQAPLWVFTLAYTVFGGVVLASWVLVKPGREP